MRRVASAAVALVAVAALAAGCAAAPDDTVGALPGLDPAPGEPRTAEWAAIVPTLDAPFGDPDGGPCHRGEPVCLDAVIAEMAVRLDSLGCDHTAPFAFTYFRMTMGVDDALGEFDDPALLSVIDARFAQQYFDAFDNFFGGNPDEVPAAWQLAFATAARAESTAAVDLLLGMNAHISRDLAYIVAELVADAPDFGGGTAAEPEDYAFVNEVIADVKSPMLAAAADRFDPALILLDTELDGVPDPAELIGRWRSESFALGVRLARAETPEQARLVEAEIERTAAAAAGVLVAAEAVDLAGSVAGAVVPDSDAPEPLAPQARRAYCERA